MIDRQKTILPETSGRSAKRTKAIGSDWPEGGRDPQGEKNVLSNLF